ncbi:MAG: hypothetical protein KGL43_04205 [Burkholderiales bacterium]|nr:hypothetical protein [Burkholderiales bacterium]
MLRDGQLDAQGARIADALMRDLGLAAAERLACAYLDMLSIARGTASARKS